MKKNCFTHNHMSCRAYGLWSRIRELQHKWGFVKFDGETIANDFRGTSKSTIYKDCAFLISEGWFEVLEPQERRADKTWAARKIVALKHAEWAAKYPSKCGDTSPTHSPNGNGPIPPARPTHSPNGNGPFHQGERVHSTGETDPFPLVEGDLVYSRLGLKQTRKEAEEVEAEEPSAATPAAPQNLGAKSAGKPAGMSKQVFLGDVRSKLWFANPETMFGKGQKEYLFDLAERGCQPHGLEMSQF